MLAIAGFAVVAQAQVQQRLVLAEEFTQASCGPCASQNPGFNAVLTANAAKVISIKYQTSWPGVDPMNAQNPTEVQTRVDYYGITGVPHAQMDGTVVNGAPSAVTAAAITSRQAVSPFYNVTVSHTIAPTLDYMSVHAVFKLNDASLIGNADLRAHLAVVEKTINFASAPGSNGEKTFYSVMKKMLPGDQGTTLPAPTAVGDSIVIDETWQLANVYDINQLAVVAFLQDNASKEVHQAAFSAPQAVIADVATASATPAKIFLCGAATSTNVTASIRNGGPNPLTSCTLRFTANGTTLLDQPWTGNLATGASATTTVALTVPAGTSFVQVTTINANTGDQNAGNDMLSMNIAVPLPATTTMPSENFAATTFPPANMTISGSADGYNWERFNTVAAGAAGSGSARLKWYDIANTQQDHLYLTPIDLSGATSATLNFAVAAAAYQASGSTTVTNDRLIVRVSTNCGTTWTNLYNKSGAALATSAPQAASFAPTTAAQWRNETIDLANYLTQSNLLIDFNGVSNFGNNCFLDNINVVRVVGVDDTKLDNHANVFPNPSTGVITANIALSEPTDMTISVTNMLGQEVARKQYSKTLGGNFDLDLTAQPVGSYFVHISTESAKTTKKVTVER